MLDVSTSSRYLVELQYQPKEQALLYLQPWPRNTNPTEQVVMQWTDERIHKMKLIIPKLMKWSARNTQNEVSTKQYCIYQIMHTYTMHSLITNIQPPMAKRLNNSQSSISPGHHDGGPPSGRVHLLRHTRPLCRWWWGLPAPNTRNCSKNATRR